MLRTAVLRVAPKVPLLPLPLPLSPLPSAIGQGVNKVLASKLIDERKATFLLAKKCSSEYEELSRSLTRAEVALPPKGTAVELRQVSYDITLHHMTFTHLELLCDT